jgi:O-antigen ligase
MNRTAAVQPATRFDPRDLGLAAAVPALVLFGYYGISDPRVSAVLLGGAVMTAWAVIAYRRPRAAVMLSFPLLLLAGTKFRVRDADASLEGVLDTQVLLELALFGLIGIAMVSVMLAARRYRRTSRAELAVGLYAGLAVLSVLWSAAPALTLVRSGQLAIVALLAIQAVRLLTAPAALWNASRALGLYVLLCGALAAIFPWADAQIQTPELGPRFAWFAMHPVTAGTLAAAAALGIGSVLLFDRRAGSGSRTGAAALLLALVAVLALTNSRGPVFAFAAGSFVLWILRVGPATRLASLTVALVAAVLVVVFAAQLRSGLEAIAAEDSIVSRALFRDQSVDALLEMNGRLALWSELQPAVADRFVSGYGYQASRPVVLEAFEWAAYAHNAFIQTVLDLGLVGLAALIAIVVVAYRGALRRARDRRTRATVAAVVTFLVVNALASESFAGAPSYEVLLLFLCACAGSQPRVES